MWFPEVLGNVLLRFKGEDSADGFLGDIWNITSSRVCLDRTDGKWLERRVFIHLF